MYLFIRDLSLLQYHNKIVFNSRNVMHDYKIILLIISDDIICSQRWAKF